MVTIEVFSGCLLAILSTVLWGYIGYNMANKRNRDTIYGFLLGAIFGLFAVIGYWIAGDKNS